MDALNRATKWYKQQQRTLTSDLQSEGFSDLVATLEASDSVFLTLWLICINSNEFSILRYTRRSRLLSARETINMQMQFNDILDTTLNPGLRGEQYNRSVDSNAHPPDGYVRSDGVWSRPTWSRCKVERDLQRWKPGWRQVHWWRPSARGA